MQDAMPTMFREKLMFSWSSTIEIVSIKNMVIQVRGDVTVDMLKGQSVRLYGTDMSDFVATVANAPTFDQATNTSFISVTSPPNSTEYTNIENIINHGVLLHPQRDRR